MGKALRKPSKAIVDMASRMVGAIDAVQPTPERALKAVVEMDPVVDAAGHVTKVKRARICSPVESMARAGWFGPLGMRSQRAEALKRYADLVEDCGYGNLRSCCDVRTPGSVGGTGRDRVVELKDRAARVRNALCGHPDAVYALVTVHAMLDPMRVSPDQHETLTDTALRIMACRDAGTAMSKVRAHVLLIADGLIGQMGVV